LEQLEYAPSWLCPEPGDRERLLDMDRRLRGARAVAMALLGVALVLAGPFLGWWPVGVLLATALGWAFVERYVPHVRKPEWLIAGGWLASVAAIAISIVLTGGADSPAKSWLLIPAITLPARFTKRGVNAGLAATIGVLALVTFGIDPDQIAETPENFLFPAALIGATIVLSMALRAAEVQHRSDAVIDPLTAMLNRKALEARTIELEQQSKVTGQPVGLILCDIDHFKQVNDTHGHAMGDAVLKDVAYTIRKELRAYDLAYRLGGEEFVVIVPGANSVATAELAERLRDAVAARPVENVQVTASFGVAASGETGLDFKQLLEDADEALYAAKGAGRNCVKVAIDPAFAALA
jgi:diguanylate cyclase (GGDEF)-like protein